MERTKHDFFYFMEKYKFKIQFFSIFNNSFRLKRSIAYGLVDIDSKFLYNDVGDDIYVYKKKY